MKIFWDRAKKTKGCWVWTAGKYSTGYGRFKTKGVEYLAHRFAWQLKFGPIEKGLYICHHCDNPSCINPKHLFKGTPSENARDRERKKRGNAPRGEMHCHSKLNTKQIIIIRKLNGSQEEIAKMFGVTRENIRNIRNRKSWRHVE